MVKHTIRIGTAYDFAQWLASPDGIAAVDEGMIARGYGVYYWHSNETCDYCFYKSMNVFFRGAPVISDEWDVVHKLTKSDAQQHAAAKALLGGG